MTDWSAPDGDQIRDRRVQYETAGIDPSDLADDPMQQWHRWYDDAVAAGVVEPNAATLSTVDVNNRPDARVLLVRGADDRGFTVFTNLESAKSRQLRDRPHAALTFAWLALHRQVRVRVEVEPVPAEESDAYFASRPRGSQIGAWASPQSAVIADRDELERRYADVEARFAGREVARPPHWGGWRLAPIEWEFWLGRHSRLHDRVVYEHGPADVWRRFRRAP